MLSVAFSEDGERLVTGDSAGAVGVWDVASRTRLLTLERIHGSSPTRRHRWTSAPTDRASSAPDPTAEQSISGISIPASRSATRSAAHAGGARAVAYGPDGKIFATAGSDGTIQLWDATSRAQLGAPLQGHVGVVNAIAFSADGKRLASTGADGVLAVWDLNGLSPLATPLGTGNWVTVAVSPDGRHVASSGLSGTTVWGGREWRADWRTDPHRGG